MGITTRFSYRYPGGTDAADGPQGFKFLAEDVEGWTARGFPCLSTARPTGVADGFIIRETDTGNWLGWTGSAWVALASGGGGGGGGSGSYVPIKGEWKASSIQSIPHDSHTRVAFGTQVVGSSVVTRNTFGSGHSFTLVEDGCYSIACIIRFAAGVAGGNRYAAIYNTSDSAVFAANGNDGGPGAVTLQLAVTDRFVAGTALYVTTVQVSGVALSLERSTSSPSIDGFVSMRITKIAP